MSQDHPGRTPLYSSEASDVYRGQALHCTALHCTVRPPLLCHGSHRCPTPRLGLWVGRRCLARRRWAVLRAALLMCSAWHCWRTSCCRGSHCSAMWAAPAERTAPRCRRCQAQTCRACRHSYSRCCVACCPPLLALDRVRPHSLTALHLVNTYCFVPFAFFTLLLIPIKSKRL